MAQAVQEQHEIAALVRAQKAKEKAQEQDDFQHA
jgi:hypothetical protein